MKKPILLLFVLCLYKMAAFGQAFEWAKIQGDSTVRGITTTSDGVNLISAAIFRNQITLDQQSLSHPGLSKYLAKHNTLGQLQWAKHIVGPIRNYNISLDTDQNQNIITAGYYKDSLFIDTLIYKEQPGPWVIKGYLAKFSPAGALQWVHKLPFNIPLNMNTTGNHYRISTDGNGNIYLTGAFNNSITFGATTLTTSAAANLADVFLVKYNPAGVQQWAIKIGGPTYNILPEIAGTNIEGVVISTQYFNPTSNTGGFSLSKFNAASTPVWSKTVPDLDGAKVTVDNNDNVYVTGIGGIGTYQFDQIPLTLFQDGWVFNDWYQAKINAAGTWLWAKRIATGNYHVRYIKGLSKSGRHHLSFAGGYSGTPDFGSGISLPVVSGQHHPFFIQMDTAGNPVKAFKIHPDYNLYNESLAADTSGNNYLAGIFTDTARLGSITLFNSNSNSWHLNTFIAKILNNANHISGTLFIDSNGNGIKDATELPFKGGMLSLNPGAKFISTDVSGNYNAYVSSGTHTIEVVQPISHYTISPGQQTLTFAANGQSQTKDFALAPIPNRNDVKISVTNIIPARPGFGVKYRISYENIGTTTLSDSVILRYDSSPLTYASSTATPAGQQAGKLKWFYQALQPQEKRQIDVIFNIPTTTPINTPLTTIATIKPLVSDFNTTNNTDTLNHVVVASFDPNDKQVNKATISSAYEYLDYTIRFQNTGTDTAFTVIVRDAITSKLFMPSLELLSSSHNYTFKLLENNVAEWRFDNILLPDSNRNEPASHGFVRFRIKPQNYLQLGDSITNSAAIYFDFNAPIITNTTVTRIMQPLGIKEEKAGLTTLYIYPNPATEVLTVEAELKQPQEATVVLRNVLGQEVYRQHLGRQKQLNHKINIQQLPKGVYLLQLQAGSQQISRRVVVE